MPGRGCRIGNVARRLSIEGMSVSAPNKKGRAERENTGIGTYGPEMPVHTTNWPPHGAEMAPSGIVAPRIEVAVPIRGW